MGKEKKEIGKLIELLNEYVEKWNKSDLYYTFGLDSGWLFCYDDVTDHKGWTMQDEAMVICSKKFGFIKWLVENDKIDYKKLKEEREDLCDVNLRHLRNKYIDVVSLSYVKLLMLLSISQNPISDLISYLR